MYPVQCIDSNNEMKDDELDSGIVVYFLQDQTIPSFNCCELHKTIREKDRGTDLHYVSWCAQG